MSGIRLNVTVPEQLADFARERVSSGKFTTQSDYVRHLIREDHRTELRYLNKMIQDGIDSGPSNQTPKQIFNEIKKDIAKVSAQNKKKK